MWQDFMYACAMYPGDKLFLENAEKLKINYYGYETPSIVLFCGNNESSEVYDCWGWQQNKGSR